MFNLTLEILFNYKKSIVITVFFILTSCISKTEKACNDTNIEVIPIKYENGWGYDITVDTKKYIHQNTIPAVSGNKLFKTKKDALTVGKLMKSKICKRILPPTISIYELDSLNINYK